MIKKFIGKVSIFMCSALVATTFFGAITANADTTENGTLKVTYKTGSSNSSNSTSGRRNFFNAGTSSQSDSFAIISMQDSTGSSYSASYCMDYNKIANNKDKCTSGYTDVTNEEKALLSSALLNGFSETYSNPNEITTEDANLYYATQCAVWVITEGAFYDESAREKLETKFGVNNATFKSIYEELCEKIDSEVTLPAFASTEATKAETTVLEYDSAQNVYETVIKDIGIVKDAVCKDAMPEGVSVEINNDEMRITSTKKLSDSIIKLTKETTQAGSLECWGNSEGHQPQATIDKGETTTDYDFFVKITTDETPQAPVATQAPKKVEEEKTPKNDTPQITVAPTVETPAPATAAPEKSNADEENQPKTGDEMPIMIIAIILGISLIGGTVLGIKVMKDKKKTC